MHRCSSSHENMVGPCTCGSFRSQTNSFSMLFSMPIDEADEYSFTSSSVDCTLSLGTPSTRLISSESEKGGHHERRSCSWWDILQSKHVPSPSLPSRKASGRGGNSNGNSSSGDPLLARRCANCGTTSTPLWRNGPRGPKSLCNACGIRFKKEERRATAAATSGAGPASGVAMEPHHTLNNSWAHHSQPQKIPCFSPATGNEFQFIVDDNDRDASSGIPFLSWRLNVTDHRPSLVHDFTR